MITYETVCLLGIPLLLSGLTRVWLRTPIGRRAAFLFTALNLLSVFLLLRVGWSFLMDRHGSGSSPPDLSSILLSFLVECGVYAALYLTLRSDGEGWSPPDNIKPFGGTAPGQFLARALCPDERKSSLFIKQPHSPALSCPRLHSSLPQRRRVFAPIYPASLTIWIHRFGYLPTQKRAKISFTTASVTRSPVSSISASRAPSTQTETASSVRPSSKAADAWSTPSSARRTASR